MSDVADIYNCDCGEWATGGYHMSGCRRYKRKEETVARNQFGGMGGSPPNIADQAMFLAQENTQLKTEIAGFRRGVAAFAAEKERLARIVDAIPSVEKLREIADMLDLTDEMATLLAQQLETSYTPGTAMQRDLRHLADVLEQEGE